LEASITQTLFRRCSDIHLVQYYSDVTLTYISKASTI